MISLSDVPFVFNRAFSLTFNKKKLLMTFMILALCGLMVVFFRGLSIGANEWVLMSLTFLPFFLCAGVLLSTGILLIRIYHDEVKQKTVNYTDILGRSWEVVIGASYFSIPIILSYLLLWIFLGFFLLLKQTPGIGEIFGVILSFGPFLLNLASLILCLLNLAMLFFVTPVVALNGLNRIRVTQILVKRLESDPFSNLLMISLGMSPLLLLSGLLIFAAMLTGQVCYVCTDPFHNVLQSFFIMIPFTALLSPAVVFFFNFAAEAHVLSQKNNSEK